MINNDGMMRTALGNMIDRMSIIGSMIDLPAYDVYKDDNGYYPIMSSTGKPAANGRSCYVTIKSVNNPVNNNVNEPDNTDHEQSEHVYDYADSYDNVIVYNYDVYNNGVIVSHYENTDMHCVLKRVFSGIVMMIASNDVHYDNILPGHDYRSRLFAKQIELMGKLGDDYQEFEQEHVNNMKAMEYLN